MRTVVIGLLGTVMDSLKGRGDRWQQWRPTVDLCRQQDLVVDRLELLTQRRFQVLTEQVEKDIRTVSPETEVRIHYIELADAWDFQEVYGVLHDFARGYAWNTGAEQYLVHITTGTHVAQICEFLLTESRHFPARLIQTGPPKLPGKPGTYSVIDLDLSKYDRIASRFKQEQSESREFLKSGIPTRNAAFNKLIDRIEKVAIASRSPLLLMGPTGAGKSQLARRIFELKKLRRQVEGRFVEVNCATIRGDGAMSALFGHAKGAFTGAAGAREGLLREAHKGTLFLDEIGELGVEEQAMLLRAIEEGRFLPFGSDREVESDFQLITGTNRDLHEAVVKGAFRDDLLARINLWTFRLPALRDRPEDMEPNLEYELRRWTETQGNRVTFSKEARKLFLEFASAPNATWAGNFRDFSAAVERMATLAEGGRVAVPDVRDEIERLELSWQRPGAAKLTNSEEILSRYLDASALAELDRFDRVQLADVLTVCSTSRSLSDAGRTLFAESRKRRTSQNDADRVRKYLTRFGIAWTDVKS